MVFSSLIFLFGYLPITLLLYYLSPKKCRNAVLFILSLLFYAYGEPIYLLLMLVSLTLAYFFGFLIARDREHAPKRARGYLIISVLISLSFLFFFKYYNFFAGVLRLPTINGLRLPIGISFYTFQILSYSVDVYRGDTEAQKNYVSFGAYVTLFPQLVAGPIVRYREIDGQLASRRETVDLFALGVSRFVTGLGKKLIIGDALAASNLYFRSLAVENATVLGAWLTVICYTLHLYYDFSGYSDMAIGLGKMFGFSFPENFNYPYVAKSITEFWRRWHMTLSSWFREYVYIPLGGNRRGKLIQCRNLAIVWALTGFWHGANWNFLFWGLYFSVILICEHLFLRRILERAPDAIRHLYTLTLVTISFLIFSFPDSREGWNCFCHLFGVGTVGFASKIVLYEVLRLMPLLFLACVGATPYPRRQFERLRGRIRIAEPILASLLLFLCTAYLVDSSFTPFAYLNF